MPFWPGSYDLREKLAALPLGQQSPAPAKFLPIGAKRPVFETALQELRAAAPQPAEQIALPPGAPFGAVEIDVQGCTLCLACVSACPTHALTDGVDRPALAFDEALCIQCGLCKATCPEKVIHLEPRIDFAARLAPKRVLKEEEPFHCISCGKPFGTKSTIEKIKSTLEDKHWMFAGENRSRIDLVMMCEDCRVLHVIEDRFDPHGMPPRPRPRTAEDYLHEREAGKDEFG